MTRLILGGISKNKIANIMITAQWFQNHLLCGTYVQHILVVAVEWKIYYLKDHGNTMTGDTIPVKSNTLLHYY